MQMAAADTTQLDFYFSPSCPWAWRTALWMREVVAQHSVVVTWKLFSLAIVNRGHDYASDSHAFGYRAEKLLVAARRLSGNAAVERLYMAIGDALHGRREERSEQLLSRALEVAGLPSHLLAAADGDPSIEQELIGEHQHAVDELSAFGVPTLRLAGSSLAVFGPVVDPVPTGAAALELWDHVRWSLSQPYLFELKRERKHRTQPLGLVDVHQTVDASGGRALPHRLSR